MPSPDLLPSGRSFPSVAAPPLDDVLLRARRRRAQRAGMVGVLAVTGVVAVTLAFVPRGSSDALHVVTPALPDHSASPVAHVPSVGVVPHAPVASKVHNPDGSEASQPVDVTKQRPSTGTAPIASGPSTTNAPATSTSTPMVGPAHRMTKYDATRPCNGSGPTAVNGWCSYYDGATAGVAGQVVTLSTAVCRLPGRGSGVLTSNTGQQAEFAVGKNASPPLWTWSHGRRFAKTATSIRVPAGTCVEWFVSWRVVTDAGEMLKPGTYYLAADPDMAEGNARASAGANNPTTFTVR